MGSLGSEPAREGHDGAAGVDGESIEEFERDLKGNLYKLWNRLSSGSYFPAPVRAVEIPKQHGAKRGQSSGCLRLAHSAGSHRHLKGQKLAVLFEPKRPEGLLYVCEGGPLGTIGLPAAWTSLGEPAAERPLTIEALIALAVLMAALKK